MKEECSPNRKTHAAKVAAVGLSVRQRSAEDYESLAAGEPAVAPEIVSLAELIRGGETSDVEFKATLRINMHTSEKDPRMELACLKTIAGFLNSKGGTLIIGVADDGEPVGIQEDRFSNEEKMNLHLVNLLRDKVGPQHMMAIHPRFEDFEDLRVLKVECTPSKVPVFVKDGNVERFYVRTGAATTELTASQTQEFVRLHFVG